MHISAFSVGESGSGGKCSVQNKALHSNRKETVLKAQAHSHVRQLQVTGKISDKIVSFYSSSVKVYV